MPRNAAILEVQCDGVGCRKMEDLLTPKHTPKGWAENVDKNTIFCPDCIKERQE